MLIRVHVIPMLIVVVVRVATVLLTHASASWFTTVAAVAAGVRVYRVIRMVLSM